MGSKYPVAKESGMTTNLFSMNRRAFLGSLMTAPLLTTACQKDYGQYFDIEWDEEVERHNGWIIIVHIKRTFERVTGAMQRSRWKGVLRTTEIEFDAGGQIGYYKREFNGYDIKYIGYSYGNWYISLTGFSNILDRDGAQRIVKKEVPIWIVAADGSERAAESWSEAPFFPKRNFMPVTPDSEGVSQFNGTLLTIPVKMAHWKKYPRAAGDDGIIKDVGVPRPKPE